MKRIYTLLALAAFAMTMFAQSPDLMTYQAVLRDAENHLLTNQAVAVQISIMQGTPNGAAVYMEVHAISTNANGLVSLMIGDGVSSDDLSLVDWSGGPYFLKTETDPAGGTNYSITSTTQLLSVPYAMYADEAGNTFGGNYADLSGAPTVVSAFANDEGYLTGVHGGEPAFDGWDKDVLDDFSGNYADLSGAPTVVSAFTNDADYLSTITGSETAFDAWDKNELDDFSGNYADLSGAPTNVSAFTNDAGYLTSASGLWSQNGSNVYYSGGNVGIGLSNPASTLTLYNGNPYAAFQTAVSGTSSTDGFRVGARSDSHAFIWNYEPTPINFGTSASQRMVIESTGDIGIGTTNPTTNLQVVGDTKFGSNGVGFNEMREITGTTPATGYFTSFALPAGYTETNTRVLSLEIQYAGNRWAGLGFDNGDVDRSVSYIIDDSTMWIYYPDLSVFHLRAIRILIMQIAP